MPSKKRVTTVRKDKIASRRKRRENDEEQTSDMERPHALGKPAKFKHRGKLDINIIIAQEEIDAAKQNSLCWMSTKAGPSSRSPRRFCIVCGWPAFYKCSQCFNRRQASLIRFFCSRKCMEIHHETDCTKPINLLNW
ncbi:hypothetical protein IE077_003323 [Cardiosporidium cionae]|uniref:HIT-type domain-containing protein n=1 Tax=Cardiosporidium cionae TaxID=476202 RepID=A0ABQ7J8I0_9APIC|nr:hypothetical protein IE077_003323 [Cardiosporidium cionae]|eukprot:KAF8820292.1 hypothetical protein IE077_003323 [Cardiosporidium cionae]